MRDSSVTVGFLHSGPLSTEQRAAYDWCREFAAVDPVSLDAVPAGAGEIDRYDVLWWHRDGKLVGNAATCAADCEDRIRSYVEDGGRLFLSLRALSAVSSLGIDPVSPDATGEEYATEPLGFLCKAIYDDHPVFAGFDDLRVHTQPADTPQPYARYDRVLPAHGDVLAGTVVGEEDRPAEVTLVSWTPGDGTVVGAGSGFTFAHPHDFACAGARSHLVRNVLAFLLRGERVETATGRPKSGAELRRLRAELADDPHRPAYHLSPPADWLNDPNGLLRWNGRYHVFYQYNPGGPYHHTIHWGHAVSDDLVHWEDEPVALTPSPDGPDRDGCWSGCAVVDGDTPTVLYTGGRGRDQLPCRARAADDDLRTWVKDPDNPIIERPPAEPDLLETDDWAVEFRDHAVWREDGTWYQLIGSGVEDAGGTVLLYESPDLDDWEYVGPLLVGDWPDAGRVWECPELLDFGEKRLLHVSNYDHVEYFVGEFDAEAGTFEPETRGRLDYGDFYAPQSLREEGGRRLTWGWVTEARDGRAQWDAGWSGTLSLPRVLDVVDGELRQRPAPELRRLRRAGGAESSHALTAGWRRPLDVRGRALEIEATIRLEGADSVGITVLESPTGRERTPIQYTGDEVIVERAHASVDGVGAVDPVSMPVENDDEGVDLHVFVDGSVVEVFANERRCLTARVYPTRDDSDGVSLAAHGGPATVESLSVWELDGVW